MAAVSNPLNHFFAHRTQTTIGQFVDALMSIAGKNDPDGLRLVLAEIGPDVVFNISIGQQVLAQVVGWSEQYAFLPQLSECGWLQCALAEVSMIVANELEDVTGLPEALS